MLDQKQILKSGHWIKNYYHILIVLNNDTAFEKNFGKNTITIFDNKQILDYLRKLLNKFIKNEKIFLANKKRFPNIFT